MRAHNLIACLLGGLLSFAPTAFAAEKPSFKVCWSIFAGWMPWGYAASEGIVKKWGDKYGIDIQVDEVPDYINSIERYTSGEYDACTMTNMDALTIPVAAGVDSTALIVGDFSDGADGILIRGSNQRLTDLKGKTILLVENSVSHYLLSRALEWALLKESDVKIQNVSDKDIVQAFLSGQGDAVITWNPLLADIKRQAEVDQVFSSHYIPGEIVDLTVINTQVLASHPELGKALTGAWYEIMTIMKTDNAKGKAAREHMAKASGTDLAGYDAQLAATTMFYSAADAVVFANSPKLPATMTKVAEFSFSHGLLGEGAQSAEAVGMSFAKGITTGDKGNVKLRFDPSYMQMAADGKL